jgi:hypothetical protein
MASGDLDWIESRLDLTYLFDQACQGGECSGKVIKAVQHSYRAAM